MKANFNPKRSLSFSKNEMVLKKNNIFLEKYTKTKSKIKNGIKYKIDLDKTIANNSNLDNINNNLKLNNDKNKKMSNSLTFSFNDEKEEKNIKILNQIEQVNNLKGKKYKNNNLYKEYLNKGHNILYHYNDNKSKIDYNQNINNNYIYKNSINHNISNFKYQQNYKIIFNPISQSSIYYTKYLYPYQYIINIDFNPYFYNQNAYHGKYYYNYIGKNFKEKNNINYFKNSDEDKKIAKEAMFLVKTQLGSQILKEKSLSNHYFANELLFPEIKINLKEICCNIFGSSLMITLLDIFSIKNILIFLSLIEENIFDICLTEPGSRVVQKLLEKICKSILLINKFIFIINSKDIGILIKSQYGNYIFRKYLSKVKNKESTNFIYNYIYKNFIGIIKEKYGICVVIKALSEADKEARKKLFKITLNNFEIVIKDCYGNYLIRHILLELDGKNFEEILPIIQKIEKNIVNYCKCQYSSSVIEICLEKARKLLGSIY